MQWILIIKNVMKILGLDKREVENMGQEMIILDEIKEKATQKYLERVFFSKININRYNIINKLS